MPIFPLQAASLLFIFLCCGAVSFFPRYAQARETEAERIDAFRSADANHDGRLSYEEFEKEVRTILENKDDFEGRGFRLLGEETQKAILNERFRKMDIGNKGYLVLSDWKRN
ncbi:EF-hand domain-containing protein [Acetobacter okinawensis]|nr:MULTISPECIES: EF-hand domain-containing protein [Acetobacteraceae]MBS0966476.1 EF-hand domain-containing protein [Acetobacter okinawensis]